MGWLPNLPHFPQAIEMPGLESWWVYEMFNQICNFYSEVPCTI